MSFTIVERDAAPLYRSKLFLPGSQIKFFEKAAKGPADVVCLDLEDAVAPADKVQARNNVVKALNEVDFGDKIVTVRVNGLDTHLAYRDIIDLVELGGERLDAIMIPKVGVAADLYAVDMLITQASKAVGRKKRIKLEVILETALLDDEQIARGSRLTEQGGADFVKTSTGFAGGGATVPHVELMRASVGPEVQVKASGGVRSYADALAMLGAGATRLGTSGSAVILGEARRVDAGDEATGAVDDTSY